MLGRRGCRLLPLARLASELSGHGRLRLRHGLLLLLLQQLLLVGRLGRRWRGA